MSSYCPAIFTEFIDSSALEHRLAREIADHLRSALDIKEEASLVVSGGKTPLGLFAALAQQQLNWRQVFITLADERWVSPQDEASNEKLVRQHLLSGYASEANFIGLKNSHATPFSGAAVTEQALAHFPRPFDVVVLGMGEDGHTASLFPGAANLATAMQMDSGKLCLGITPLTAPLDRLTLTLPALLDSRQIYLHLVGERKLRVYQQAVAGQDWHEMPVRAILHQTQTPVEVFWSR